MPRSLSPFGLAPPAYSHGVKNNVPRHQYLVIYKSKLYSTPRFIIGVLIGPTFISGRFDVLIEPLAALEAF